MKIFISHSSRDGNIANSLSEFLEGVTTSVEVFCSSQIGSIKVGQDFVKTITESLTDCDAFIPLLSPNYYSSGFCMVELGFAYSVLASNSFDGDRYIFPVAVPPIKKGEALMGTPLAQLQVSSIHEVDDLRMFLESIFEKSTQALKSRMNRRINEFVYNIKKHIFERYDIHESAQQLVCKSQNVPGEDGDYLNYSVMPNGKGYTVNFKAKPFAHSDAYPDFLSFVYQYVDKVDLYEPANLFKNACLKVCINNFTNSVTKIDIEIKYSDNNLILHRRTITLTGGENSVTIPLNEIKREALRHVSEICFVIKPSAYVEDEGMFQIIGLEIDCNT